MQKKQIYKNKVEYIPIQNIDPSPYQKRKYFNEDKIKLLAKSIQKDGLIEPIIVRPKDKRFELIAGEYRLRAIKNYTKIKKYTDCPLSTQRLNAAVVSQMQKKRIFRVIRRTLIIYKKR